MTELGLESSHRTWTLSSVYWQRLYAEAAENKREDGSLDWMKVLRVLDQRRRFTQTARQMRTAGRLVVAHEGRISQQGAVAKAKDFYRGSLLGIQLAVADLGEDLFDELLAAAGEDQLHPLSFAKNISETVRNDSIRVAANSGYSRALGADDFFNRFEPTLPLDSTSKYLIRQGLGLTIFSLALVHDRAAEAFSTNSQVS